jgi:hypothetical protein
MGDKSLGLARHAAFACVVLSFGIFGSPGPTFGQDASAISLTVRGVAGRTLKAKRRHFVAVNVSLDNPSTSDSKGTLRVYRVKTREGTTPAQSLFYERRIELPRSGRRTETVYYYCQEGEPSNQLCVSYEPDEGPPPLPAYPKFEIAENEIQVLVLTSQTESEAYSRSVRAAHLAGPLRFYKTQVQNADLAGLPDHLAGYDSFDAILVAELDATDLPPEKAGPLLDWVSAGGDLIVSSSGGRSELPPALRAALPIAPSTQAQRAAKRDLSGLRTMAPGAVLPGQEPVLVERVQALPGAEIVAGDAAGPLVIRGRFGAGYVTYTAFPLDAAALRAWRGGIGPFGAALLRLGREDLEPPKEIPSAPPLEELLYNLSEALETLEPPSALLVAPLLLLYVALVSPINFVMLSRIKRLRFAQASATAVALGFGAIFFGIGFVYKGSDALVTQIGLIELPTAKGKARVDVLTGYFSTDRGITNATTPYGSVAGPIANTNISREGRVVYEADGGVKLEALTLDTWALRRFRTLRAEDVGYLDADLHIQGRSGKVTGSVTNRTEFPLQTAMLLMDGACLPLDSLAPGATLQISNSARRLKTRTKELDPFPLLGALVNDASGRYPGRYGLGIITGGDPYASSPRRRILHTLQARLARVPRAPGKIPALLVARVEGDPGGVLVSGNAVPTLSRSLVLCELQVETEQGVHALTGLTPRVIRAALWQPTGGSTGAAPMLKGALENLTPDKPGFVEWEWRLPASTDAPIALETLRFRWKLSPRPLPKAQTLQGYSFRTQSWIPLQDMGLMRMDRQDYGRWPVEEINPLIQDLVDPTTGRIYLRMLNYGQHVVVEDMVLDAGFRK